MPISIPLQQMTREEKLRAMEAIWADLSQDDSKVESPAWHADELRVAEERVRQGKETFSDWNEAKERIRRKASEPS